MAISLLAAGCEANLTGAVQATPTAFIITITLPPPALSRPTQAPFPSILTAIATPIEGKAVTQLNVRAAPSTASAVLGMIALATKVQIVGKDASGNWYEIAFQSGAAANGWITSQYVEVVDKDTIPVVGGGPSGSSPSGVIMQQVNVRSGAGMQFKSLGTLNPKDVVSVMGKDASGIWLQIQYPPGATSTAWIKAAYVETSGLEKLPILASSGEVIGTGTPTGIPLTVTPTLIAAPQDNDSGQSPAVNVSFSPSGARSFIYSSDVSSPEGDAVDWIEFTSYDPAVRISLICRGNGALNMDVLQNGITTKNPAGRPCGQTMQLDVVKGRPILLRLYMASDMVSLEYVHYTLSVESAEP